jgi:hypothetical protein
MSKKKDREKESQTLPKEEAPRRRLRWILLLVLAAVVIAWLAFAHSVRGTLIEKPTDSGYSLAVRRITFGNTRVNSQTVMNDLGAVAHRAVEQAGLKPGVFYVHFLPKLDAREKLHHALHSPFTGLRSIYTDIWINSCTTYAVREPTWSLRKAEVYPADCLSILILLIDRLKREKSAAGEHIGAYIELLRGMEVHTVHGRASCYLLLVDLCAGNRELTQFVLRQLGRRRLDMLDTSESEFWRCIAADPTYRTLRDLAAGEPLPEAPPAEKRLNSSAAFMSVLTDRVTPARPEEPDPPRKGAPAGAINAGPASRERRERIR